MTPNEHLTWKCHSARRAAKSLATFSEANDWLGVNRRSSLEFFLSAKKTSNLNGELDAELSSREH